MLRQAAADQELRQQEQAERERQAAADTREQGELLAAKEAQLAAARNELQGARDTIAYLQDAISCE